MNRNMKPVQNLFTYRAPITKLVVSGKKMQRTKLYAIFLVLVMLVGIFILSAAISLLTNSITIPSGGSVLIPGTNVWAISGSPEDIQAAVDAVVAAGGGTVYVPEGDFVFNPTKSPAEVVVPGGVNVIGQGKGVTILRETQHIPTNRLAMFHLDGANGLPIRISGISFIGYVENEDETRNQGVQIVNVIDFRVDHCEFIDFSSFGCVPSGGRGVIDHCDFDNPYKDVSGGSWGYGPGMGGDGSWEPIDYYLGQYNGKKNIVYIEDCTLSRLRHATDCATGGWYVVRHCTITEPRPITYGMVNVHGFNHGRGLEAYNNTIIGAGSMSSATWIRGGGGVIFNNTFRDFAFALGMAAEATGEYAVNDLWFWGNTLINVQNEVDPGQPFTEGVEFFLEERPGYVPYTYPHPLTTLEASPAAIGAMQSVIFPSNLSSNRIGLNPLLVPTMNSPSRLNTRLISNFCSNKRLATI